MGYPARIARGTGRQRSSFGDAGNISPVEQLLVPLAFGERDLILVRRDLRGTLGTGVVDVTFSVTVTGREGRERLQVYDGEAHLEHGRRSAVVMYRHTLIWLDVGPRENVRYGVIKRWTLETRASEFRLFDVHVIKSCKVRPAPQGQRRGPDPVALLALRRLGDVEAGGLGGELLECGVPRVGDHKAGEAAGLELSAGGEGAGAEVRFEAGDVFHSVEAGLGSAWVTVGGRSIPFYHPDDEGAAGEEAQRPPCDDHRKRRGCKPHHGLDGAELQTHSKPAEAAEEVDFLTGLGVLLRRFDAPLLEETPCEADEADREKERLEEREEREARRGEEQGDPLREVAREAHSDFVVRGEEDVGDPDERADLVCRQGEGYSGKEGKGRHTGKAGREEGDKSRAGVEEEKERIEQEGKERRGGDGGVDDRKDMN